MNEEERKLCTDWWNSHVDTYPVQVNIDQSQQPEQQQVQQEPKKKLVKRSLNPDKMEEFSDLPTANRKYKKLIKKTSKFMDINFKALSNVLAACQPAKGFESRVSDDDPIEQNDDELKQAIFEQGMDTYDEMEQLKDEVEDLSQSLINITTKMQNIQMKQNNIREMQSMRIKKKNQQLKTIRKIMDHFIDKADEICQ